MSTRARVALKTNGKITAHGSVAVRSLYYFAGLSNVKPVGTKQEKLTVMAKCLPEGCSLVLIQEPRRTRKVRSLYWQMRFPEKQQGGIGL